MRAFLNLSCGEGAVEGEFGEGGFGLGGERGGQGLRGRGGDAERVGGHAGGGGRHAKAEAGIGREGRVLREGEIQRAEEQLHQK